MGALAELLADRIRREGPLRYHEVIDAALYHPDHGFYSAGGQAGRAEGDFITSPEVGPLFGAVVARALDGWWRELGSPDPFLVVEAGAGRGALALAVLRAEPECSAALRYVLVERSAALRERQAEHLDLQDPAHAMKGPGPAVMSVPDLLGVRMTGVVLANELLDNLPIVLLERGETGWWEVRVGLDSSGLLAETMVVAHPTLSGLATDLAPAADAGARIPVQSAAKAWLREARGMLDRGRIVCFDYADTTAGMAARPWPEWLRTYRSHQRGGGPLDDLGHQDITCDVAIDQLAPVLGPPAVATQADWLAANGLADLVEEGRRRWEAGAAKPGLEAIEGRSRVTEAEALTDPAGLGAHRVLEWPVHG